MVVYDAIMIMQRQHSVIWCCCAGVVDVVVAGVVDVVVVGVVDVVVAGVVDVAVLVLLMLL